MVIHPRLFLSSGRCGSYRYIAIYLPRVGRYYLSTDGLGNADGRFGFSYARGACDYYQCWLRHALPLFQEVFEIASNHFVQVHALVAHHIVALAWISEEVRV